MGSAEFGSAMELLSFVAVVDFGLVMGVLANFGIVFYVSVHML